MSEFRFLLNPRGGELPHCSAVLNGRGRQYTVEGYRTTLSLKSVVRGAARYITPQGQYLVTPDTFLVLNEGQRYSLEFEGCAETETLCPFFQPGFVEQAAGSATALEFCERLYPKTGAVGRALAAFAPGLRAPHASAPWLEDRMYGLAQALADLRLATQREAESFPGLRPATRIELYRRLHRGRDFILSCYDQPLTVAAVARVAGLAPFHFQRMFKAAFGRTPMQFLQDTRLDVARRLLAGGDAPVTEICLAVGFESLGSFSWLFHKRFGASPRAFREGTHNEISRIQEVSIGAMA